jgi:hypothetical protein
VRQVGLDDAERTVRRRTPRRRTKQPADEVEASLEFPPLVLLVGVGAAEPALARMLAAIRI